MSEARNFGQAIFEVSKATTEVAGRDLLMPFVLGAIGFIAGAPLGISPLTATLFAAGGVALKASSSANHS